PHTKNKTVDGLNLEGSLFLRFCVRQAGPWPIHDLSETNIIGCEKNTMPLISRLLDLMMDMNPSLVDDVSGSSSSDESDVLSDATSDDLDTSITTISRY
ncbi:12180_t:CDS:2, partial [Dentiscutata heterogama]